MVKLTAIEHHGHASIELVDRRSRLVIVHAVGPRIASFGAIDGDNLLFWDTAGRHTRGDWRLYGGHRLWIARPHADESEETYAPDNRPCRVRELPDGVAIISPPTPSLIEKTIAVHAGPSGWRIEHRLRNVGDMLWSGGAWGLTCTLPNKSTRYRIPLDGGDPNWDVLTMVVPRRWGGDHSSRLADPQFAITEEHVAIRARGIEAKRMLFAPRGMLEMQDARGRFTKTSALIREGTYPLNTNVAIYLGTRSFMVELETMGPLVTLAPKQILRHVEKWTYEPC